LFCVKFQLAYISVAEAKAAGPGRQVSTSAVHVVPSRLESSPLHRRQRSQGPGPRAQESHRADVLLAQRRAGTSAERARREAAHVAG